MVRTLAIHAIGPGFDSRLRQTFFTFIGSIGAAANKSIIPLIMRGVMDLFAAQVRSLQNNQNYFPLSSLGNMVIMVNQFPVIQLIIMNFVGEGKRGDTLIALTVWI